MEKIKKIFLVVVKYLVAIALGGLYVWAILLIVKDDNWNGISAITTMSLAIAAFWAIRQNYSYRKKDSQGKLMTEIRNWANEGLNFVTRYRVHTGGAEFPKQWEAIARLSYLASQDYTPAIKNEKLIESIQKAHTNIKECLDFYHKSAAMNILLTRAMKCEDTLIEVLNEITENMNH